MLSKTNLLVLSVFVLSLSDCWATSTSLNEYTIQLNEQPSYTQELSGSLNVGNDYLADNLDSYFTFLVLNSGTQKCQQVPVCTTSTLRGVKKQVCTTKTVCSS